ncbi:hypothetical protein GQ600_15176 [Phytophthora cactorum]|nr:hypothetical protein GQ600_15176 [Phytophthora cactorum]
MTAPPPRARSGSVSSTTLQHSACVARRISSSGTGALAFELSFVSPDALTANPEEYQDVLHVLDAAAAAEDSDKPPTGADAFYQMLYSIQTGASALRIATSSTKRRYIVAASSTRRA